MLAHFGPPAYERHRDITLFTTYLIRILVVFILILAQHDRDALCLPLLRLNLHRLLECFALDGILLLQQQLELIFLVEGCLLHALFFVSLSKAMFELIDEIWLLLRFYGWRPKAWQFLAGFLPFPMAKPYLVTCGRSAKK